MANLSHDEHERVFLPRGGVVVGVHHLQSSPN